MSQAVQAASSDELLNYKSTAVDSKTVPRQTRVARVPALDFTKGALVLVMVLYHWLNYFVGTEGHYYNYLRFLTPSFIFVTGVLISIVYLHRDRQRAGTSRRLLVRAFKLLAVFVLLNVGRSAFLAVSSGAEGLTGLLTVKNLVAVFLTGNILSGSAGKIAAFYILVPISYLLILSSILIPWAHLWKFTFQAACAICLAGILVLYLGDFYCFNLEVISIGFLGILIGMIPIERINRAVRHPFMLAIACAAYLTVITIWDVTFPLLIVGVCISVGAIYFIGLNAIGPARAYEHIVLLGKYSLFGYIAQIAILQILSLLLRHIHPSVVTQVASFLAAFALTMSAVEVTDRLRAKLPVVDKTYQAVFA